MIALMSSRPASDAAIYPPPKFAIPVLEGQSRAGDRGLWCAIYGLKSDKVEDE
jgi:hypothetical protein